MTEHLPECPCIDKAAHPDGCLCCEVASPCICDRLRACEARVREDERSNNFTPDDFANAMAEVCQRSLEAAREAVKHLQHSDDCYYAEGVLCHCEIKRAITAIDALRKELQ